MGPGNGAPTRRLGRRRALLSLAGGVMAAPLMVRDAAAETLTAEPVLAQYWAIQAAIAYPGPGREQWGDRELVISLSTLVSTGTAESPDVATPLGHYRVSVKLLSETMEGTVSGEDYRVEDVPWVMYVTDVGHALHGTYWRQNFGYPMSHGCVNLPLDVAEWMFGWTPEGTGVTIVPWRSRRRPVAPAEQAPAPSLPPMPDGSRNR